jgi:hypothetical protein
MNLLPDGLATEFSVESASSDGWLIAGRGFDLTLATGPLLGVTAGVTLLGLFFGALALLIGAATGSGGLALAKAAMESGRREPQLRELAFRA